MKVINARKVKRGKDTKFCVLRAHGNGRENKKYACPSNAQECTMTAAAAAVTVTEVAAGQDNPIKTTQRALPVCSALVRFYPETSCLAQIQHIP